MTATQVSVSAALELRERRAELRAIEAALEAARRDEGQILLLSGPAGVGKTALLRAAVAAATNSDFLVLGARGGELEQSFPWGVVGQLFASIVHDAKEQGGGEDLLAGDARLAELALSPAAGSPSRDADFALLNALYWLCGNLCERSPVLLVVDDAHWADAGVAALSLLLGTSSRWHGPGARGRGAPGRARGQQRSLCRAWTRGRRAPGRARSVEQGRGLRSGPGAVVGGCERRALPGVSRGDARQRVLGRAGHRRAAAGRQAPRWRSLHATSMAWRPRASPRALWLASPRWDRTLTRWPRPRRCSAPGPSPGTPPRSRSSSRIGPSTSPTACGAPRYWLRGVCSSSSIL